MARRPAPIINPNLIDHFCHKRSVPVIVVPASPSIRGIVDSITPARMVVSDSRDAHVMFYSATDHDRFTALAASLSIPRIRSY